MLNPTVLWLTQCSLCCQDGGLLPWAVMCRTIHDTLCQSHVLSWSYDGDQVFRRQVRDEDSECVCGSSDVEFKPDIVYRPLQPCQLESSALQNLVVAQILIL